MALLVRRTTPTTTIPTTRRATAGPNASFTHISSDFKTGIVNFNKPLPTQPSVNGIAPGGTDYFSLEEPLSIVDFCQDTITLTPASATSVVGGPAQTFTATILDLGTPAANIPVTFTVSTGPHAGLSATPTPTTNASGQAQFVVPSSAVAGTDIVQASYHDPTCTSPPTHSAVPANMVWTKASPTITTQPSPTVPITVGTPSTVGDTATFQNTVSVAPTGSVTFKLYKDNLCATPALLSGSGAISTTSPFTASFSSAFSAPAAGTYYWVASYVGDSGNNGYTTACADPTEVIAVGKASPSIATQATPTLPITVGTASTVGDTATIQTTSPAAPTGSVTFTLYTDNLCATPALLSGSGAISTTFPFTASFSSAFSAPAAGTYYWQASYAGDANNKSALTACGAADEEVAVSKASPSITTQASPTLPITVGTLSTVGDTATIQTPSSVAPTGSVTFTLYTDRACTMPAGVSGSGAISRLVPVDGVVLVGVQRAGGRYLLLAGELRRGREQRRHHDCMWRRRRGRSGQ